MTYELLIAEKPKAALRIASALADKSPTKKAIKSVPYYELTHNSKKIVIVSAVGHLFSLAEETKSQNYPVFDVVWTPNYLTSKDAKFTKKYYDVIKKLSKDASEFTICTDFDIEGSTIGYNCLAHICKKKDGKRMKFSTLTKNELIDSYENATPHLDFPQIEAGITRHNLDYFYGISTSRALTNSIKNATHHYKIMSTGRVQGPTLKIIVDREKEIKAFIAEPYWQLQLLGSAKNKNIEAYHEKGDFKDKKQAEDILKKVKGKEAIVDSIEKKQFKQNPPFPFDLTSLQVESYRCLRIPPNQTLQLAQNLYLAGLISYPRTSSQQLPPAIDYKKILQGLAKQSKYKELVNQLLKKSLSPNNGKKTDAAHPAIYPTGEIPKTLTEKELKVYSLITHRTLATFSEPATRETQQIKIDVNKEIFIAKGTITKEKGWHVFYQPFLKLKEEDLPDMKKADKIAVKKINLLSKETQPPKRFTPSSIIKKMETLNLGTKATRSAIVDTLFKRNYIDGTSLEATNLGIKTIETLEKYCPEIIDAKLTEHFEEEMQEIQDKKKKKEEVLDEAKKVLTKIFKKFKENELKIGKQLSEASMETRHEASIVGKCQKCGKNLLIKYSKKNRQYFISCEDYKNCKNTFSLPYGTPKTTNKVCPECGFPLVTIIRKGKRPWQFCINRDCKKKEEWFNKSK